MTSLCVKFKPSSTPPSDRFWWGVVLVLLVLLLVLVTGVKQSQLVFDKSIQVRKDNYRLLVILVGMSLPATLSVSNCLKLEVFMVEGGYSYTYTNVHNVLC